QNAIKEAYLFRISNLDWVGNEFTFNAGAGLVISQPEGVEDRNSTVVEQLRAAFERDWFSRGVHPGHVASSSQKTLTSK
uniref:Uncharacterized protein n=1 Tax=Sphaeramia orbicularis TaxID=375764 RepID=A0A673BAL5_9TELE